MPDVDIRRPLKVVPDAAADNAFEQLVAAVARIETGLGNVVDAMSGGPDTRDRVAALALCEPEPAWLADMRRKYDMARTCRSSVVVVDAAAVAHLLRLIDLARKGGHR